MTIHIDFTGHKCIKCSAVYIPFKKNFKCPNCGIKKEQFFDFVSKMIKAMRIHKEKYGQYGPPAWYFGSFAERIQIPIFNIFDALEKEKPEKPKKFIAARLSKMKWGENKYLEKHIRDIALAVYDICTTEDGSPLKSSNKKFC